MKSDKNTFDIGPVVTKGNKTVSIPYDDGQLYFDIFVYHYTEGKRIINVVECKTRQNYNANSINSLKRELKNFIIKAYKSIDHLKKQYNNDYKFLFISNIPFGIWNDAITIDFLNNNLEEINPLDNDKISDLKSKLEIMILSNWVLNLVKGEWAR